MPRRAVIAVLFATVLVAPAFAGKKKKTVSCPGELALAGRPNEWGPNLTTDPRSHDDANFLYLAQALREPWAETYRVTGRSFLVGNYLEDPSNLLETPYVHTSLVSPLRRGTYGPSGLLLRLPSPANVMGAFQSDLNFNEEDQNRLPTEEDMRRWQRSMLATGRLLDPLATLARAGERAEGNLADDSVPQYDATYNDVVVATTGPDGDEVEVVGAYLKVGSDGKPFVGPFSVAMYRRFAKRQGLPLVFLSAGPAPAENDRPSAIPLGLISFNALVTEFYEGVFESGLPPESEFEAALKANARQGKVLGDGINAIVYEAPDGFAYKVPHDWTCMPALMMEALLDETLAHGAYPDLRPHLVPIEAMGELGSYLKRPVLPAAGLATNIPRLSATQEKALEVLFRKAIAFAMETGVALDLKAHNLYWNGSRWQIFDLGARRSYRPYGYTSDLPDFATYLRVWRHEEPPDLSGVRYRDELR